MIDKAKRNETGQGGRKENDDFIRGAHPKLEKAGTS